MATVQLATWIASLKFPDLPDSVVKAAVRSFENSFGCILGGSLHPTVERAIQSIQETATPDQKTVFSFTNPIDKVLVQGIASHVHDYDDTHLRTVIHPAGAIVTSLLAYSERLKSNTSRSVSGKEFITALTVGIETSLRLGNSISPNHYTAGWHITGTVSPLGVAAALSNLLHLDVATTTAALGIASTQPVGLRVHFGTDTKALHVGRAAQIGIQAVELAQAGFTAATDALEGERGWVEVLGHGANSLDKELEEMLTLTAQARNGANASSNTHTLWEIEKNTFKPFPCGIVIHPIIDACIQARSKYDLLKDSKVEAFQSVQLKVHPLVLDLTGKKTPRDGLEAKFSVYHGAAIGLLLGSATPAEYDDNIVTDSKVVQLRDKVKAEADETVRSDETYLQITLNTGEVIELHVEHAVGSLDRPMTDVELQQKFMNQVEPVTGREKAMEIDKLLWDVCSLEDVTTIVEAAKQ